MIQNQKQTAILLFAFSPKEEAKHKNFYKSEELFQQLNQKTLVKAQKTGVDVLVISEKEQIGITFGERFTNAIQEAFNKGYSQVITIGNDSPNLKTSHLTKALQNLESGNVTLGPSLDGGTYLIALKKEHFSFKLFQSIAWNTNKVYTQLRNFFVQQKTEINQLCYLVDIDSKKDIIFFVDRFYPLLKDIITFKKNKVSSFITNNYSSQNYSSWFYNKGSPYIL